MLGENRDVARECGRVTGHVRHCPGTTSRHRFNDGTPGTLTRRVQHHQIHRINWDRRKDRSDITLVHPCPGHIHRGVLTCRAVTLDHRHLFGTDDVAEEATEQTDTRVEIQHPLPWLRLQEGQHGVDKHLRRTRVNLPEPTLSDSEPHPAHQMFTGLAGDQAVIDRDHLVRTMLTHAPPTFRQWDEALASTPPQPVVLVRRTSRHLLDRHLDLEASQPRELLADHLSLQRPLARQVNVLEVAAAAQAWPGVPARRSHAVHRRLQYLDGISSPEPVAIGAFGDCYDHPLTRQSVSDEHHPLV